MDAGDRGQIGHHAAYAHAAEAFRLEHGRVVASVLRIVRDIDTAEEIVQEAFEQAIAHWPVSGTPARPGAWLLTTARRRALDHLRRTRRAEARVDALAYETALGANAEIPDVTDPEVIPDDRLRLIFTCCHPSLAADSQIALTLRLVGGLSTAEIARAFLLPEATIAQRLVRAKRAIRDRGIPYEVPEGPELSGRLPAVLAVIYLVFNEGYAAHTGDALLRHDLCEEALRLGDLLAERKASSPAGSPPAKRRSRAERAGPAAATPWMAMMYRSVRIDRWASRSTGSSISPTTSSRSTASLIGRDVRLAFSQCRNLARPRDRHALDDPG